MPLQYPPSVAKPNHPLAKIFASNRKVSFNTLSDISNHEVIMLYPLRNNYSSALLFTLVSTISISYADSDKETFTLSAGASLTEFNSEFSVNGTVEDNNASIDMEDDLGQDEDVDFVSLKAIWRPASKHRISLEYSPFSRSSRSTLSDDVEFRDYTIKQGSDIDTDAEFAVYDVNYIYSVYTNSRLELGLSVGIYWLDYEFDIRADGFVEDDEGNVAFDDNFQDGIRTDIPLPLFGIHLDYQLSQNWQLIASGRYFDATLDEYQGDITSLILALDYNIWRDLSLGLSVSRFELNVDAEKDDFDGYFGWEYSGAQLYLIGRF